VFFTTGITPALSETLAETTQTLLGTETTTAFDLNYRGKLWSPDEARATYEDLLPAVDLLFASERTARSVLGCEGTAASIADGLRTAYDCEIVVVTQGADGAVAQTASDTVTQSTFESETLDPVGTGDAFVGAFLSRYVRGASLAEAMEWGAATAALKRTIAGDLAVVTPGEVESVISQTGADIDR
jgi:2-dehydro-3-deoxygluconokinase